MFERITRWAVSFVHGNAEVSWLAEGGFPPPWSCASVEELGLPVFDEDRFVAGRLSSEVHVRFWDEFVLAGQPDRQYILGNLQGIRLETFLQRFEGEFKG